MGQQNNLAPFSSKLKLISVPMLPFAVWYGEFFVLLPENKPVNFNTIVQVRGKSHHSYIWAAVLFGAFFAKLEITFRKSGNLPCDMDKN